MQPLHRHVSLQPLSREHMPQGAAADAAAESRNALGHVSIFENILRPEQLDALVAIQPFSLHGQLIPELLAYGRSRPAGT